MLTVQRGRPLLPLKLRWLTVHSSNYYGRFLSTVVLYPSERFGDSLQLPAF